MPPEMPMIGLPANMSGILTDSECESIFARQHHAPRRGFEQDETERAEFGFERFLCCLCCLLFKLFLARSRDLEPIIGWPVVLELIDDECQRDKPARWENRSATAG